MQPSVLRRLRLALAFSAGLVLAAAAGASVTAASSGPSYEKKGSVHLVESGGCTYTFDTVWRAETLHRIDPATGRAVRVSDPVLLARLRAAMLRKVRVATLEGIPVEGKAEVDAIRALGYI